PLRPVPEVPWPLRGLFERRHQGYLDHRLSQPEVVSLVKLRPPRLLQGVRLEPVLGAPEERHHQHRRRHPRRADQAQDHPSHLRRAYGRLLQARRQAAEAAGDHGQLTSGARSMAVASLPMYDLPELRAATDAWWKGLARAFRREG